MTPTCCLMPTLSRRVSAWPLGASEKVLVFGDFDADGLTGLAVMTLALRRLGLDVAPYVPDRTDEGHGLSVAAIDRAAAEGRSMIVTVDTGTSSGPEVALAATRGIDVLVTDHHRVTSGLPRGSRGGQPAPSGLGLSGPAPGRCRRRLQARPAVTRRGSARLRGPGGDRHDRRRRAAGRRKPGNRAAGPRPVAQVAAARAGRAAEDIGRRAAEARRGDHLLLASRRA